jgi:hypothetical protein
MAHLLATGSHPGSVQSHVPIRGASCHQEHAQPAAGEGGGEAGVDVASDEEVTRCGACQLSDFLSVSYEQGGLTALVALEGLLVLIQEHNLEYPRFYASLYKLVTLQVGNLL